jgi:hypothetical protein
VALARASGDDRDGAYTGTIPGPDGPAQLSYFFRVRTTQDAITTDPASDGPTQPLYSFRVLANAEGTGCTSDSECAPTQRCESGTCIDHTRACAHDTDCLTTEKCDLELAICVPQ